MEYTEYMETLKEQIQNKRARSLVAEEIRGHIEEQAKEYQAEGMMQRERPCGRWAIRWRPAVP